MNQLVSDTVYRSLAEKGLALSPVSELIVPDTPAYDKGLMSMFTSMLKKNGENPR